MAAEAAQLARPRRVGLDLGVANRSDHGHGIRLVHRGPGGAVVREADVEVVDAPDPYVPKVTLRRASRTDPLAVLKRAGTINAREREAGDKLHDAIERAQPSLLGVSRSDLHVAPQNIVVISERTVQLTHQLCGPLPSTRSVGQRMDFLDHALDALL